LEKFCIRPRFSLFSCKEFLLPLFNFSGQKVRDLNEELLRTV